MSALTESQLAGLAVNAAHALIDEKRHYAIACQEITRLRDQSGVLMAEVERLTESLNAIQAVLDSRITASRTDGAVLQQIAGIVTRAQGGAS